MTMSYKTKQTDTFTQFVKGDDNPGFADRLAKLQEGIVIIMNEHKLKYKHLAERNARIEYNTGKRYIKMIYLDGGSYSRRVHGFIDRTNGDVLMPAGWNAPAKSGARGNIWNQDYGLNAMNEYGVNYKGDVSNNDWIVEIINEG